MASLNYNEKRWRFAAYHQLSVDYRQLGWIVHPVADLNTKSLWVLMEMCAAAAAALKNGGSLWTS